MNYESQCYDIYNFSSKNNPIRVKNVSDLKEGDLCVRVSDKIVYCCKGILNDDEKSIVKDRIYYDFGGFIVHKSIMHKFFSNLEKG